MRKKKLKKLPILGTDRQAEDFIAKSDLTQYDLSGLRPVRFEFEKKSARISMRLPEPLLAAVKRSASSRGIPYQRFIRETLEKAVAQSR
jgi:predicted DNA binding CopG/RHH family protein